MQYDKVQLNYCHITAPFGRVGLRLIDPGNVVQANGTNPLVVVTQEQPITVIFTLPKMRSTKCRRSSGMASSSRWMLLTAPRRLRLPVASC